MKLQLLYISQDGVPYHFEDGSHLSEAETGTDESFLRQHAPKFFSHANGMREHRSYYRGFVLCRHTMRGTGWSKRVTVLYLLDVLGKDVTMIGQFTTNQAAQRKVDQLWQPGDHFHPDRMGGYRTSLLP